MMTAAVVENSGHCIYSIGLVSLSLRFAVSFIYIYVCIHTVKTRGITSCQRPRCNICYHVTLGNTIRVPDIIWNVKGSHTCISLNLIYTITCIRFQKLYIEEIKWRLADRFTEHLRSIKNSSLGISVAAHFNSSEHSIFNANVSKLNDSKAELMLVTSKRSKHLHNLPTSITIGNAQIPFKQSVKNLVLHWTVNLL